MKVKIDKIKISDKFKKYKPKDYNVQKHLDKFVNNDYKQYENIVVDDNYVLVDSYIQYLLCKEYGIEEVDIVIRHIDNRDDHNPEFYKTQVCTYVYGVHLNGNMEREYVWRVPLSWYNFHVEIGDKIMCRTKYGLQPVIVTRVETVDNPPREGIIRKVARSCEQDVICN